MKIFLTGGTGFIGLRLVDKCLAEGWEVLALVRHPDGPLARALAEMGARCIKGDILDVESLRAGMSGADMVIHNAGWYEYGMSDEGRRRMYDINVTGTENVLGTALEMGIPRTLYISSTVYYGETDADGDLWDETNNRTRPYSSWYEETKTLAHEVSLRYQEKGLPLIIICPSQVIGPNDHSAFGYFLRMYLNRLMTPFAWSPDKHITFVHVDDLSEGIVLAARKGSVGETYILSGATMSKRTYVGFWMQYPGAMKVRFYIPDWLAKIMFTPFKYILRAMGLPAFISPEAVRADVNLRFSSAKAQRELGWAPKSGEAMWRDVLEKEIALMPHRKGQGILDRLRPIE